MGGGWQRGAKILLGSAKGGNDFLGSVKGGGAEKIDDHPSQVVAALPVKNDNSLTLLALQSHLK